MTEETNGVESGRGIGAFPGRAYSEVALQLTNGTMRPINLEHVVVQMAYGRPTRSAQPVYDIRGTHDFGSVVKPGASVTGVYAYAIPKASRGHLTMHVDFDGIHAVATFAGSVG